jgi:hypothetical protein
LGEEEKSKAELTEARRLQREGVVDDAVHLPIRSLLFTVRLPAIQRSSSGKR